MLSIVCKQPTNRLKYVCDIIFDQFLNIPYQLISYAAHNVDDKNQLIVYGHFPTLTQAEIIIPDKGLMYEKGVQNREISYYHSDISYIFYYGESSENIFNFDIFSAVFYLLTEYDKYQALHVDIHGRYNRNEYLSHGLQLQKLPIIHLYIDRLRKALQRSWPDLVFSSKPKFDYEITIDVDVPWKYLNKGLVYLVGGGIKQLIKGDIYGLIERGQAFFTQKDPNDTFEELYQLYPPNKTTFFFLLSKRSRHDSRFDLSSSPYQTLIRQIYQLGYNVGIHPSYESFLSPNMIKEEKEALETFLDIPIYKSRQHFLKYRLPDTFRALEAVGIRHEYSLCDFHQGGFPTGIAQPYRWYDLLEERISDLWIHPTVIMDWSLLHYMSLTPSEAINQIQSWIEACQNYGGLFTILIHNDALSESVPWKGWKDSFIKIINTLKANS